MMTEGDKQASETDKSYVRIDCESRFLTDKLLMQHTKLNHSKEEETSILGLDATDCRKSTPQNRETQVDSQVVKAENTKKDLDVSTKVNTKLEQEAYPCEHCNKSYNTKLKLRRHMIVHLQSHPCGECGKSFPTKDKLNRHTITHSDERNFTCDHCGLHFRRKDYLNDHVKKEVCMKTLGGVPLQECSKCVPCKMYFPDTALIKRHMREKHPNTRLHKCTECPHYFHKPSIMRLHSQSHSELRLFTCDVCDKTYKRKDSLRFHMRRFNHFMNLELDSK